MESGEDSSGYIEILLICVTDYAQLINMLLSNTLFNNKYCCVKVIGYVDMLNFKFTNVFAAYHSTISASAVYFKLKSVCLFPLLLLILCWHFAEKIRFSSYRSLYEKLHCWAALRRYVRWSWHHQLWSRSLWTLVRNRSMQSVQVRPVSTQLGTIYYRVRRRKSQRYFAHLWIRNLWTR